MTNKKLPLIRSVLLLVLVGCVSANGTQNDADRSVPIQTKGELAIEPTPSYIYELWPEPGSINTVTDYETLLFYDSTQPSVCVEFETKHLLEKGDFFSTEELLRRFSLEIDGTIINEPSYVFLRDTEGYDGPSDPETGKPLYHVPSGWPYFLCFATDLNIGLHNVTFTAKKTSGRELTYSWYFNLESEEETMTPTPILTAMPAEPYPRYIEFTSPAPGSVGSTLAYKDDRPFEMATPGICVSFLPYPFLLEAGDYLTTEDVLVRLSLEIDGLLIQDVAFEQISLGKIEGTPRVPTDPSTGLPLMSVPEGIYIVCFATDLDTGLHSATFIARKTSGDKLRYTWSFTLTED